ncbi:MAG: hypothetical protein WCW01_01675 [Gammaproteobacteria bacterium]
MKKMAIVSSYNELCGNATYTEVLRKGFSQYYDVTVLPLKVKLLTKVEKCFAALGDQHIEEIAKELQHFDYVNIQFEAGLFGVFANQIYRRIRRLVNSSKNLIVTMHRYDQPGSMMEKHVLKDLASLKITKALGDMSAIKQQNYFAHLSQKIITLLQAKGAALVVHTKREKELILARFRYKRIYDHPISFLTSEELSKYKEKSSRKVLCAKYGFDSGRDVLIGIFGFVSKYKGHHVAIDAMRYLPDNYKLLIFGSQHPASVGAHYEMDSYMESIVDKINKYELERGQSNNTLVPLKERVVFCGSTSDDEFIEALFACDFNVLPYYETGQSGSGIASLTLETHCKAVFSQNNSFMELEKYAPGCFKKFAIGNYLELADSIRYFNEDFNSNLDVYFKKYNINTSIEMYRKIFEQVM